MKRIVFIGGIGKLDQFGGELTKNKEIIKRLRDLGYKVTEIDSFQCGSSKIKLVRFVLKVLLNLIVHFRSIFIFSTSFRNIYPIVKIIYWSPIKYNLIYWVIGGNIGERIRAGAYSHRYLKLIDLFIVEGIKMKYDLVNEGYNNVWYMPNLKTIGDVVRTDKFNDGRIHFVFLSRIMPDKGCDYILQAAKSLNDSGYADKFVIDFYGNIDPEYKERFMSGVEQMDNVNYCGTINLLDPANYKTIARYNVMLFPTYWKGEGFPGVVIDAYKSGIPILASDWNLNPEFIKNGKTGLIFPTHSSKALKDSILSLINREYDLDELSENCYGYVARFDTTAAIPQPLVSKFDKLRRGWSLRKLIKQSNFIYYLRFRFISKDYKKGVSRMNSSSFKSKEIVNEEMKDMERYWHTPSFDYIRYELFNKELSKDELLDYIPTTNFYNDYLDKRMKNLRESLYDDKLLMFHLFRSLDIETPYVIAVILGGTIKSAYGKSLDLGELERAFDKNKKYFFKPVTGNGGTGICVYKFEEPLKDFISKLSPDTRYIVQEGLVPRADFAEINSSSINTIRAITQHNGSKSKMTVAILRIGRNGKDVDNSHQGGMSCQIDVTTGKLYPSARTEHGNESFTSHPDSGFIFQDHQIDGWDKIKETVEIYADLLPEIKDIGWDIAITDKGLVVIELNLGFGIAHIQCTCGGARRLLNVYPSK